MDKHLEKHKLLIIAITIVIAGFVVFIKFPYERDFEQIDLKQDEFTTQNTEEAVIDIKTFRSFNPDLLPKFNYPDGWHILASTANLIGQGDDDFAVYLNNEPIQIYGDAGAPSFKIMILSTNSQEKEGAFWWDSIKVDEVYFQSDEGERTVRVIYFGNADEAWVVVKNSLDFSEIR